MAGELELYLKIGDIRKLIQEYPNDSDLGKEIRDWYEERITLIKKDKRVTK
jgi:hypothetical protein